MNWLTLKLLNMTKERKIYEIYLGSDTTAYVIKTELEYEVKEETPYGTISGGKFDTLKLAIEFIETLN